MIRLSNSVLNNDSLMRRLTALLALAVVVRDTSTLNEIAQAHSTPVTESIPNHYNSEE